MRDLEEKLPIQPEVPEKTPSDSLSTELIVNWKSALSLVLAKNESEQRSERAWAKLCSRVRELSPETNWLTISEISDRSDDHAINAFRSWLETLVSLAEWPKPKQVIIMGSDNISNSWKIIFDKRITQVPFATPPLGLSITPWKDKHNVGWKVMAVDNYKLSKAGEA